MATLAFNDNPANSWLFLLFCQPSMSVVPFGGQVLVTVLLLYCPIVTVLVLHQGLNKPQIVFVHTFLM